MYYDRRWNRAAASALSRRNLGGAMSERHGASRRWWPVPAASAVPLTTRIFSLDNALG